MTSKDDAPPFRNCILAAYPVTKTAEDVTSTVIKNDYDDTDHKPHLLSNSGAKPWSDKRREIEGVFADLRVMTKTDVNGII